MTTSESYDFAKTSRSTSISPIALVPVSLYITAETADVRSVSAGRRLAVWVVYGFCIGVVFAIIWVRMRRRDPRDRGCCSINFLEYVLHVFNLLFLAAGLAVLGVGVWTVIEKQAWLMLLTKSTFVVTTYLLVSAGAAVVVVAVIGWCVISREDRCGILMYSFLLMVIFLVEALAGMLGYIYAERVYLDMQKNLNATFLDVYYFDASKTAAIDTLQQEYRCCGAVRFEDWEASRWFKYNATGGNTVPDSCCKSQSSHCGIRNHPNNIYYDGCIHRLVIEMRDRLIVLGAVGSGLCLVQIFGIIFTFCLYYKLRDFNQDPY